MIACSLRVRKKARRQRSGSVAKRIRACMPRRILHDVSAQHESDSRLRSGLSSAFWQAGAERKSSAVSQRTDIENPQQVGAWLLGRVSEVYRD